MERDDHVTHVYRKSLLYLVSNAFERTLPRKGRPILGMAKFEDRNARGGNPEIIHSGVGSPVRSNSKSHGGFDNDLATMNDILRHILGGEPVRLFSSRDLDF